jgi:hypothetical protein
MQMLEYRRQYYERLVTYMDAHPDETHRFGASRQMLFNWITFVIDTVCRNAVDGERLYAPRPLCYHDDQYWSEYRARSDPSPDFYAGVSVSPNFYAGESML